MEKQRFIILEDCQLLCNGLREWLRDGNGYQVVMQTGNWTEFKKKIELHHRTNVISSFHWILKYPGLQEFNDFFKLHPLVNVVCLDDGSPTFSSISFIDTNICGVINLTSCKDEFLWGVKNIIEGRFYVSRRMSTFEPGPHENLRQSQPQPDPPLSKQEEDILNYISLGFTDQEIGEALYLSRRTVSAHRLSLIAKLGAKNTAHLVRCATERTLQLIRHRSYN